MEPNLRIEQEFRLQHRHSDGSWSPMAQVHPDPAEHDAERSWLRRMVFRCTTCSEEVEVTGEDPIDEPAVEEQGLIGG
jgi:hypothetical protein